jgi:hypothetical protein
MKYSFLSSEEEEDSWFDVADWIHVFQDSVQRRAVV